MGRAVQLPQEHTANRLGETYIVALAKGLIPSGKP